MVCPFLRKSLWSSRRFLGHFAAVIVACWCQQPHCWSCAAWHLLAFLGTLQIFPSQGSTAWFFTVFHHGSFFLMWTGQPYAGPGEVAGHTQFWRCGSQAEAAHPRRGLTTVVWAATLTSDLDAAITLLPSQKTERHVSSFHLLWKHAWTMLGC